MARCGSLIAGGNASPSSDVPDVPAGPAVLSAVGTGPPHVAFRTRASQCNGRGPCVQGRLGIYGIAHASVPAGTRVRRTADLGAAPSRSGAGGLLRPTELGAVRPAPVHEACHPSVPPNAPQRRWRNETL